MKMMRTVGGALHAWRRPAWFHEAGLGGEEGEWSKHGQVGQDWLGVVGAAAGGRDRRGSGI